MTDILVRPITPEQTHPLRSAVLRPGLPLTSCVFPGDDDLQTRHFGAFLGEGLIGIASLYCESLPGTTDPTAWRLRGMAVAPEHQGRGCGRALLQACLSHIQAQGGTRLWCNARTNARGFYERLGFDTRGEEFDIPGVGPHFVMCYNVSGGVRPC